MLVNERKQNSEHTHTQPAARFKFRWGDEELGTGASVSRHGQARPVGTGQEPQALAHLHNRLV